MSDSTILAWYFSDESRKLRFGDGRKIKLGHCHKVKGEPIVCKHGLHASVKILDALRYAPGPIVYRVELSGEMDSSSDNIAAQKRRYLAGGIDVSSVLNKFARKQALSVAHLWGIPPVAKEYLETGDESLKTEAGDAASDIARDVSNATSDIARAAAWATIIAAANDATWAAVASRGAAAAVARATTSDVTLDAAEKMLVNMIEDAIKDTQKDGMEANK